MPKIAYTPLKFNRSTLVIIEQANQVIEDYATKGYRLTLRQLFYQFVSRNWIQNRFREYKRLGDIVNNARLAGHLDWVAIEDRTRGVEALSNWGDPSSIINSAAHSYRTDKWATQKFRLEVWTEKQALSGVFSRVCQQHEAPLFCCRGYTSSSAMWGAAQRLASYAEAGQQPVVLHFGDHDPSGVDMTRDIEDRLAMFGARMELHRIALNMDQIRKYNPPPNYAKETDSRHGAYHDKYGSESWELDALDPETLSALVTGFVDKHLDKDAWAAAVEHEQKDVRLLQRAVKQWPVIAAYLQRDIPPPAKWVAV